MRFILVFVLCATPISAQDWSQWRGPGRDGMVPAASTPQSWPESLRRSWQLEVGEGYSSPVYMSSPVYGDGLIYAHSAKRKGQFVALDEKTGAIGWSTEGREGEHASLLLTSRHVVFLTNSADLIVARRATPTFAVEKRYRVADASTWGMPILIGSDIIVRDATGLIRLSPAPVSKPPSE